MFPYRKILELHGDHVSLRNIAKIVQHSRQKVTEVIRTAERKGVKLPLSEEMTDKWLEEFLFPEKRQEASGRHIMDFERVHTDLAKPNVTFEYGIEKSPLVRRLEPVIARHRATQCG